MLQGLQEADSQPSGWRLLPRASKLTKQGCLFCGCPRDSYDGMRGSCAPHLVMQLLCEASWCGAIIQIKLSLMGARPPAGLAGLEQGVAEQVPQCITPGIPEAPQQSGGTASGASAQLVPGQLHLPEPQWLPLRPEAAQGGPHHLICATLWVAVSECLAPQGALHYQTGGQKSCFLVGLLTLPGGAFEQRTATSCFRNGPASKKDTF